MRHWSALGKRRFGEVAEFHRNPQPVDSLARELAEVVARVVVHAVEQFVAVERRALYRAEKAPRYSVFEPRLALGFHERQKRAVLGGHEVFEIVYPAPHSFVVFGGELRARFPDTEFVAFPSRDFPAREFEGDFSVFRQPRVREKRFELGYGGFQIFSDAVFVRYAQAAGNVEPAAVRAPRPARPHGLALCEVSHKFPLFARRRGGVFPAGGRSGLPRGQRAGGQYRDGRKNVSRHMHIF